MIPQLRDWHGRYERDGLTIVGVHSPEFFWEKPHDKVVEATGRLGIAYPVVQDNDFTIWKKGTLRYRHIGEGAYAETEQMIQRLLAEGS